MKLKFISLLLLVVLLSACTQQAEQTDSSTVIPAATITLTRTAIPPTLTSTPSPMPTHTYTPVPTATSTRVVPTLPWTPIPTLNETDGVNLLMAYYENNGGCALPCWWGITPGETTWAEARSKLSVIGPEFGPFLVTRIPSYQYSFRVSMALDPLDLGFFEPRIWVEDGMVYGINLNTGWIQKGVKYTLPLVLREFGEPEEIWIRVQTDVQDKPLYELALFYPHLGLLFNSSGEGEFISSGVKICPQTFKHGIYPAAITLYTPNLQVSFEELQASLFDWTHNDFLLVELSSITDGYDEAAFYETYVVPNTSACFEVEGSKP